MKSRKKQHFTYSMRQLALVVSITALTIACLLGMCDSRAFNGGVKPRMFDSKEWKEFDPRECGWTLRSAMIKSLLRDYDFLGWTRTEVIEVLGQPDQASGLGISETDMVYRVGLERQGVFSLDNEYLVLRFTNGRVRALELTVD